MKIRFAFHKGKDLFVGKAIVVWTWVLGLLYNWGVLKYNFSHEELWLPDKFGDFTDTNEAGEIVYLGRCFSSTTRGEWNGVRFAPAQEIIGKHPERWDYIECDVDPERLEIALEAAERLTGAKYDFMGIFGFIQPFIVQDPKKWYCSEILDWFKFLTRVHHKRQKRVSPRRAAYLLARKYGELKSVKEN